MNVTVVGNTGLVPPVVAVLRQYRVRGCHPTTWTFELVVTCAKAAVLPLASTASVHVVPSVLS